MNSNRISRRAALAAGTAALAASLPLAARAAGTVPAKSTADMPQRRPDRTLSRSDCLEVIRRVDHAVLATADGTGAPYAVWITPIYTHGRIYFHGIGAGEGRKAANLAQNPRACLCYLGMGDTDEPNLSVHFVSVNVEGPVRLVKDVKQKAAIMREVLQRHTPHIDIDAAMEEKKGELPLALSVYELDPVKITGKARDKAYELYFGHPRAKRG